MAERVKTGLAIFGLSVLAIIAVELVARVAILSHDSFRSGQLVSGAAQSAYQGADFDVEQLFTEFSAADTKVYQPYIVWSRIPFGGELININEQGNRVTTHNSPRKDSLKVWVLGGSTTWGTAAPDDQTIPSHLAKLLNNWGVDTQVRNLGETAFVSTQEVIYLLRELQAGGRPDMVIFYDGANDSSSAALWPEVPGTHQNLRDIRNRFEDNENAVVRLLRSTALSRVARFLVLRLSPGVATSGEMIDTAQVLKLGEQSTNIWLENYQISEALGQSYGFDTVFVLQPSLDVGEKPQAPSEEDIVTNWTKKQPFIRSAKSVNSEMRRVIRQRLQKEDAPVGIHDVTDVFSDVDEPIYIDWVHITGKGNQLVAEKLLEIVTDRLCTRSPAHASDLANTQLTIACQGSLTAK